MKSLLDWSTLLGPIGLSQVSIFNGFDFFCSGQVCEPGHFFLSLEAHDAYPALPWSHFHFHFWLDWSSRTWEQTCLRAFNLLCGNPLHRAHQLAPTSGPWTCIFYLECFLSDSLYHLFLSSNFISPTSQPAIYWLHSSLIFSL